jgi:hypothetical protein
MSLPHPQSRFIKPAFIIGVTGHMDIDPTQRERIEHQLERIFDWLDTSHEGRDDVLGPGLELKNTPIVVLSSLAPGADQWVVKLAQEYKRKGSSGIQILAPLPFVKDQYLEASTFKRNGVAIDEAASKFLAGFPDQDVFVVRVVNELDLDDDELRRKHASILSGPEGKLERNRRYAAAGEYVAAYSDILIALTDKPIGESENVMLDPGQSPGARTIAELKRRGLTSGRLPILPALSWVDNGPVIHVYASRRSKKAGADSTSSQAPEFQGGPSAGNADKLLEILYPYDYSPSGAGKDSDPVWVKEGQKALESVVAHIRQLNSEEEIDSKRATKALAEMLPETEDDLATAGRALKLASASDPFKSALSRLALARRWIADLNRYYSARVDRQKSTMFVLAFCVVLFFSLAEYWQVPWLGVSGQLIFFLTALGLMLAIWRIHRAAKEPAKCSEDYRAIAEGLRVQFYWAACGLGESVASNYLQRQRGELGWIRHVISAIAFPYELCRVWFEKLSPSESGAVLKSIQKAWLDGQHRYFNEQKVHLTRRERVFSIYSAALVATGILLQAFLICFPEEAEARFHSLFIALLPVSVVATTLCLLYLRVRFASPRRRSDDRHVRSGEQIFPPTDKLVPKWVEAHLMRWIVCTVVAIAFSFLAIGLSYALQTVIPGPPVHNLVSILKNLAFAGGVLCGVWIETNFFKENLRRYDSMASLFRAASLRFNDQFRLPDHLTPEEKLRAERHNVGELQSLLRAVGREALSENAEWLTGHRARPLEAVSALG